jgi:hypothetical protein
MQKSVNIGSRRFPLYTLAGLHIGRLLVGPDERQRGEGAMAFAARMILEKQVVAIQRAEEVRHGTKP